MLYIPCVKYIGEIGTDHAAHALLQLLNHRDDLVRRNALHFGSELFLLAAVRPKAIRHLEQMLKTEQDADCRVQVQRVLQRLCGGTTSGPSTGAGPADVQSSEASAPLSVSQREDDLEPRSDDEQTTAAEHGNRAEGETRPTLEEKLSFLMRDLSGGDTWRERAISELSKMGDAAASTLLRMLDNSAPEMQTEIIQALGKTRSQMAVERLVKILYDNPDLRWWASGALFNIGECAIPSLRSGLDSADPEIRAAAAYALAEMRRDDTTALLVHHFFSGCELNEVPNFGPWGPGGETAIRAISPLLKSVNPHHRSMAVYALGDIGSESGIGPLLEALCDPDEMVVGNAIIALGRIKAKKPTVVNALISKMDDDSPGIRRASAESLKKAGHPAALRYFAKIDEAEDFQEKNWPILSDLQHETGIYNYDILHLGVRREVMLTRPTKILRVVVASPSDVQAERDIMPRIIDEVNRGIAAEKRLSLILNRWETDAHPGFHLEGPQGLIDPITAVRSISE
jgi:HEAT repeat protein